MLVRHPNRVVKHAKQPKATLASEIQNLNRVRIVAMMSFVDAKARWMALNRFAGMPTEGSARFVHLTHCSARFVSVRLVSLTDSDYRMVQGADDESQFWERSQHEEGSGGSLANSSFGVH